MNYCNESRKYVVKRYLKTAKEEHDAKQLGKLFHELIKALIIRFTIKLRYINLVTLSGPKRTL